MNTEYDTNVPTHFKIINEIPQQDLKGKNPIIIQEIQRLKEYLCKSLKPSECKRVKQLRAPLSHLYYAYIGEKGLRLTFTINLNSCKITLKNLKARNLILKY